MVLPRNALRDRNLEHESRASVASQISSRAQASRSYCRMLTGHPDAEKCARWGASDGHRFGCEGGSNRPRRSPGGGLCGGSRDGLKRSGRRVARALAGSRGRGPCGSHPIRRCRAGGNAMRSSHHRRRVSRLYPRAGLGNAPRRTRGAADRLIPRYLVLSQRRSRGREHGPGPARMGCLGSVGSGQRAHAFLGIADRG